MCLYLFPSNPPIRTLSDTNAPRHSTVHDPGFSLVETFRLCVTPLRRSLLHTPPKTSNSELSRPWSGSATMELFSSGIRAAICLKWPERRLRRAPNWQVMRWVSSGRSAKGLLDQTGENFFGIFALPGLADADKGSFALGRGISGHVGLLVLPGNPD